jgi:hypothetical protein
VGATVDWLTPPEILRPLGFFDLDPCACAHQPWDTAWEHFTRADDGLAQAWRGRVWLNPPYGAETGKWLAKLAEHGDGIALVFARTETRMFFESVWPVAHAVLFLAGRPHFYLPSGDRAKGNSGGPVVLIAYGLKNAHALETCGLQGKFVRLK